MSIPKTGSCKVFCCVSGCRSKGTRNRDLSFHLFPKKNSLTKVLVKHKDDLLKLVDLRTAWILTLNIARSVSPYMKICSLHFKDDDFIRSNLNRKRRVLKKNAIPNCNLPIIIPSCNNSLLKQLLMGTGRNENETFNSWNVSDVPVEIGSKENSIDNMNKQLEERNMAEVLCSLGNDLNRSIDSAKDETLKAHGNIIRSSQSNHFEINQNIKQENVDDSYNPNNFFTIKEEPIDEEYGYYQPELISNSTELSSDAHDICTNISLSLPTATGDSDNRDRSVTDKTLVDPNCREQKFQMQEKWLQLEEQKIEIESHRFQLEKKEREERLLYERKERENNLKMIGQHQRYLEILLKKYLNRS